MKILVDFVRAEQHWDPDTGDQQNYLIFGFGGVEHKIPVEEKDIVAAVKAAGRREPTDGVDAHAAALARMDREESGADPMRASRVAMDREMLDQMEDEAAEELEREFGGDVGDDVPVTNPPVLFAAVDDPRPDPTQNAEHMRRSMIGAGMGDRPRTRDKIKQEKLDRMRATAQMAPQMRVEKDDMGYPVVQAPSARGPSVGAGATIERRPIANTGDDDPFGQG